jgi:anhydro-N-acetylmuramic acid kinase
MFSIGLMSGTSMDGIDAALLETDGTPNLIKDCGHISMHYAEETKILLKAAELAVRKHQGNLDQAQKHFPQVFQSYLEQDLNIPQSDTQNKIHALQQFLGQTHTISLENIIQHSTELHQQAIQQLLTKTMMTAKQIDVIGYHGQTLFHKPALKKSIVVGNGQALSDHFKIIVVNDFRSRDVAAGGQGAPFAPLYHQALAIQHQKIPLAVVNCGGIANITLIANHNEMDLIGFDTGPGNGLIDRLVRQRTQGKEFMDRNGQYGLKGKVHSLILNDLYEKALTMDGHNYFDIIPPKSLDIGDMTLIPELNELSLEDACATLEAFTADSILQGLKSFDLSIPKHWILAGGGWHNPVIRQQLEQRLVQHHRDVLIQTADEAGWNTQAMEAQIFAYFAVRRLANLPISFPGTTRVPAPMIGGEIHNPS